MAGNHYEQINVSGGAVHAGDTIFNLNFTSDVGKVRPSWLRSDTHCQSAQRTDYF